MSDDPNFIPARPRDPFSVADAKAQVVELLNRSTRPILDAYPPAERLAWTAKEAEAAAFMAAEEPVAADYPMLRGECAAEQGLPAGDVTLPSLADKAEAVLWLASQWRQIVSQCSGLRKRAEAAIDAAEDDDARRAVLEALSAELVRTAQQ